jgi:hypothetical protein
MYIVSLINRLVLIVLTRGGPKWEAQTALRSDCSPLFWSRTHVATSGGRGQFLFRDPGGEHALATTLATRLQ